MFWYVIIFILLVLTLRWSCRKQVLWFYRPTCGYCSAMQGDWDEFSSSAMFNIWPYIETMKVNLDDPINANLADKYNVNAVPYLIRVNGDNIDIYEGNRKSNDILAWASS